MSDLENMRRPALQVPLNGRPGVQCPFCHVQMNWFHSRIVPGCNPQQIESAFMCMSCNRVEVKTSELK